MQRAQRRALRAAPFVGCRPVCSDGTKVLCSRIRQVSPPVGKYATALAGDLPGCLPMRTGVGTAPVSQPHVESNRLAVHLLEQALPRRLVVAPAEDLRAVADATAACVVERDLDDELR